MIGRLRAVRLTAVLAALLVGGCSVAPPSVSPIASVVPGEASGTPAPGSAAPSPISSASNPADSASPATPSAEQPAVLSADLIQAAVADGSLDEATGLLYRVYAIFEDPRLPEAYRAAGGEDVVAQMRAPREIDSMPPDIAAELRPYLARPTDPISPFFDVTAGDASTDVVSAAVYRASGVSLSQAALAAVSVTCDPRTRWGSAVGTNWLKVWGRCGDPASDGQIQSTVAVADSLWSQIYAYMNNRAPIEDAGTPDQGGDTRIDIYLVSNCIRRDNQQWCIAGAEGATWSSREYRDRQDPSCAGQAGCAGVSASSAFILVNRSQLANQLKLKATLAHELFHAFEYSFNHDGFLQGTEAQWFLDASAHWAEWRFAGAATEVAPTFSVFQRTYISLQSPVAGNGYLSFGWPLFLEQHQGPGAVATAWALIVGKSDNTQIMDAISGVLNFEDNFRIFAMRLWNKELGIGDPMDPLLPADPVSIGQRLQPQPSRAAAEIDLQPTRPGTAPRQITENIPTLFGHYQPFKVDEDVGHVIVDFSGLAPADLLDVDALVKVRGKTNWERRDLPDGRTTWCMDNPDDDIEQFVVVLSNHAHHTTPSVTGNWTVESPAEPCLSYHIKIDWIDTWDGVADGVTFDGYADTVDPNSIGDVIVLTGTGTATGTRAAWLACNPGLEGENASGTSDAIFMAVIAPERPAMSGDTVTVSAWGDNFTVFAGVQTRPFELPREGGTLTMSGVDPNPGEICPHGYSGTAEVSIEIKPP